MKQPKSRRRKDNEASINSRACLADDITEFEEFQQGVLKMLRQDLKNGMPIPAMRKKYAQYLTARKITIGLTEPDSGKALTAIKDVMDREEGRASEHKTVVHKYAAIPDEQLDAVLRSQLEDLADDPTNVN